MQEHIASPRHYPFQSNQRLTIIAQENRPSLAKKFVLRRIALRFRARWSRKARLCGLFRPYLEENFRVMRLETNFFAKTSAGFCSRDLRRRPKDSRALGRRPTTFEFSERHLKAVDSSFLTDCPPSRWMRPQAPWISSAGRQRRRLQEAAGGARYSLHFPKRDLESLAQTQSSWRLRLP